MDQRAGRGVSVLRVLFVALVVVVSATGSVVAVEPAGTATAGGHAGSGLAPDELAVTSGPVGESQSVSGAASTEPPQGPDNETDTTVQQLVTLSRTPTDPGSLRASISFVLPEEVDSFVVTVPAVRQGWADVDDTGGFSLRERGVYQYNGSGRARLTLTLSVSRSTYGDGQHGVDPGPWAFVETPAVAARWPGDGPQPTVEETVTVDGQGVGTPGYSYLGSYTQYQRTVANETLYLVVPDAASLRTQPRQVLSLLARASRLVETGGHSPDVYGFALPSQGIDLDGTLGTTVGDSFWVQDRNPPDDPDTAWVHEYFHTRENVTFTRETSWVSEGLAEYYTAAVTLNSDRTSFAWTLRHLRTLGDTRDVLTRPREWQPGSLVAYEKGQRVMAALAVRIRNATDGRQRLADVVRRLNRQSGPVSHRAVLTAIKDVAGRDTASWYDRYTTTAASPTVPRYPHVYTLAADGDADGDGVTSRVERTLGTHPFRTDSDSDQLDDGAELEHGTHPLVSDSDDDGVLDGREVKRNLDPLARDSDGDGRPDSAVVTTVGATPVGGVTAGTPEGVPGPGQNQNVPATTVTASTGTGPGLVGPATLLAMALLAAFALLARRRQ
jgi:hypothetical protein